MSKNNEMGKLFSEIRKELNTAITEKAFNPPTNISNTKFYPNQSTKNVEYLRDFENRSSNNKHFLNITAEQKIDDDIKRMRMDLKRSYDLFTSARDTLDAISFENVRSRIKDLHLYPKESELNEILGDNPRAIEENLAKLDNIMGTKFRSNPEEFEEIPELNSFFKVCTQLETGLRDLKSQQTNFNDLQKRIQFATTASNKRTDDILRSLQSQITFSN